jgi:hypothetical protein
MVKNYYLLELDTVSFTLKMTAVRSFETLVSIQYWLIVVDSKNIKLYV